MTSPKLLGAAAIVASLLAPSAFAQTMSGPANCAGPFPDPGCRSYAPANPSTDRGARHYRRTAYRQVNRNDDWNRTGFWPADTAAGVAGAAVGTAAAVTGAAVGTAGAIATAPFRTWDNSYARDNSYGYNGYYDRSETGWYGNWDTYAARNGIVCRPGTYFKGDDGRQHLCQ